MAPASDTASCQQLSFMKLMLKGGGDAPPKVVLHGELPAGLLKFREKEVNMGPVPLHQQQTVVVQLKNAGADDALQGMSSVNKHAICHLKACGRRPLHMYRLVLVHLQGGAAAALWKNAACAES